MTTEHPTPSSTLKPAPGIAGRMANAFIHSPLSFLFYLTMLFLGAVGLFFTPRQEDPQISVPMVDIFISYPGAAAQQVSRLAIEPLQRILSEIPAIEHVYSAAERGRGLVTVQFEVGELLEHSIFKVHDKLQSNLDKMPPGVMPPLVKPKGIDDVPVVTLTLWSEEVDDGTLRTLALDVMQHLKEIENTGQSFVVGGRTEQVLLEVKPEQLSAFGISLAQVAQTIQTANSESQAGQIETGNTHFTVYTGKFLSNAQDIAQLVIGSHQGTPVYVRDVANVVEGPEPDSERRQFVNYYSGPSYRYDAHTTDSKPTLDINAAPAVTIAIAKKVGTNGVTVAQAILDQVDKIKGRVIPDNIHVEITRNYGQTANDKVWNLIFKLFIATGAVTLLVLWSFRHITFLGIPGFAPAAVVTLVIPVVVLITIFSAWILGYTIDRVSLFALIFSIGILVDDAIVVIENIYRHWLLKGETDTETAVDAVREVGNPTILATFTVVAALLPMGFVSGMMGPYMEPIPALGSVAMIFSLLAAFMFTPWLAMRIRPSIGALQTAEEWEHHTNEKWERFYRRILPPLFNSTIKGGLFLISLIVGFFAALALFYTQHVEVKMLPLDNKPEFNVFINLPEGAALLETTNITHTLAEELRKIPEVTALQTYIGTSQPFDFNGMVRHYYLREAPWLADIHIQLQDKKDRLRSSHQIAVEARRNLQKLLSDMKSLAKITIVEMPPGPPVLQSVVAEVYGPDDKTRRELATQMTQFFSQTQILDDVDNYMSESHEIWYFKVNTEKAVLLGISVDIINQNLAMALGGFKVGDIKQSYGTRLEPTYILMQVPLAVRSQLSRLYDLPIPTPTGGIVPLAELGSFEKTQQDPVYYQKDLRPVEYVVADAVGVYNPTKNDYRLSAPIYGMREVEAMLGQYSTPDGINLREKGCHIYLNIIPLCDRYLGPPKEYGESGIEWTGEWTVTYETFRDMGFAFAGAMVLIYILVVWLFGNFVVPAIIMVPIPLTLLGIIPGHWFVAWVTNSSVPFTATSMIGWIALAGIIVRNSILLVDYSIHEIQKGTPIEDAVILACKTRTRPILITAFALVAGSSVILTDPIFQGMAISLLFGVLVSTLLTLVVIPLGCISIGPATLCQGSGGTGLLEIPPTPPKLPLWLSLWGFLIGLIFKIINLFTLLFYLIRMPFLLLSAMMPKQDRTPPPRPPRNSPPPVRPTPSSPPSSATSQPLPTPSVPLMTPLGVPKVQAPPNPTPVPKPTVPRTSVNPLGVPRREVDMGTSPGIDLGTTFTSKSTPLTLETEVKILPIQPEEPIPTSSLPLELESPIPTQPVVQPAITTISATSLVSQEINIPEAEISTTAEKLNPKPTLKVSEGPRRTALDISPIADSDQFSVPSENPSSFQEQPSATITPRESVSDTVILPEQPSATITPRESVSDTVTLPEQPSDTATIVQPLISIDDDHMPDFPSEETKEKTGKPSSKRKVSPRRGIRLKTDLPMEDDILFQEIKEEESTPKKDP